MPLYEYQCKKCGKKSEFIQNFSDPHETKCPRCGGLLKKLLSSPAVQFKGSGFYATDYAKPGSRSEDSKGEKSEKSEKSEEKKDSSKGEEGKSGGNGGSEAKGDSPGAGKKEGDSAKGGGESGGASGAASSSPTTPSSPAPSKKKKGDRK